MELKVKLLGDAVLPEYAHDGDSGFDLRAAESVVIYPGQRVKIPTGICFGIPEGYEIQVRNRSGVGSKTKLIVIPGTVDSNYIGEVKVTMDNMSFDFVLMNVEQHYRSYDIEGNDYLVGGKLSSFPCHGPYVIEKGQRIAQAVLAPVAKVTSFSEVDELEKTVRGDNGHGSSGIN